MTAYRTLGRSGLVVSPLALGTMTFGPGGWNADDATARELFDAYLDAGGNLVDTADIYAGGGSEALIGRFLQTPGLRERVVLSTKFGFNASASPLAAAAATPGHPHAGGAGAKNLHRALDASLQRLRTDHIDLYWMHIWDGVTPVEEIVETLANLVRAGKIRYYGLSDMPAWFAMKAATLAHERGLPAPVAIQVEYSLVARDVEAEHVPAAREGGMGVMPWSPLAGGFLSGKYRVDAAAREGRLAGPNPFGDSKFSARNWAILEVVREVAEELGSTPSAVALAWVMGRPGVASTLIGARTRAQLDDNLAAMRVVLSPEQRQRLDAASAPPPTFSTALTLPAIGRMVFGGHEVRGWMRSTG